MPPRKRALAEKDSNTQSQTRSKSQKLSKDDNAKGSKDNVENVEEPKEQDTGNGDEEVSSNHQISLDTTS